MKAHGPARSEALAWALFAQAAVVAALIVPVHILVQGVLGPLGLVPVFDQHYSTFAAALGNWLAKLYLLILFGATFWVFAHRVRYTLLELGVPVGKKQLGLVLYGVSTVATVAAAYLLVTVA